MSDIIETYQEEQELEAPKLTDICIAKIVEVTEEGVIVQFEGEEGNSTKAFPFNVTAGLKAGMRAVMQKINGTYVAMLPVGTKAESGGGTEIVDDLTSTAIDKALSANQGRVLNGKIPTVENVLTSTSTTNALSAAQGKALNDKISSFTARTTTANTGSIAAGKSTNSYISISNIKFLTGYYCSNANIFVDAYQSGTYVYWRAFNIGTASASGTISFSYVT